MTTRRLLGFCIVVFSAAAALGQTPLGTEFTYQGRLSNVGAPANGLHDLRFQLYDAASSGAQVGTQCVDNATVTEGLFTVRLDFGAAAFNGDERWLEIGVRADNTVGNCSGGAYTTLSPRQNLTPAPYAMQTRGMFVNNTGKVGIGTTNPDRRLTVGGGLSVYDASHQGVAIQSDEIIFANAVTDEFAYQYTTSPEEHDFFIGGAAIMSLTASGLTANSFTGSGLGLTGVNADLLDGLNSTAFLQSVPTPLTLTGTSSLHIVRGENTSINIGATGVSGWTTGAGNNINQGVYGRSNSTQGRGVLGWADATTGATSGVYGLNDSTSGRGVYGIATTTTGTNYGGYFLTPSNAGVGVNGLASASSGFTRGVVGESASTIGRGVYGFASASTGTTTGVYGQSDATTGRGVYGTANASTGTTFGVSGISYSTAGVGVAGTAQTLSGTTYGGSFLSNSPDGYGVKGYSTDSNDGTGGIFRSDGRYGFGVAGVDTAPTGTNYGVVGQNELSAQGFAIYALGDMGAYGNKPFRIDHPFDPENKYLLHYAAESPYPQNFYVGNVVTDATGSAWIDLPDYFAEINTNFKYQLTVIEDGASANFVQVKIGRKIKDNRFLIMSSAPNVEVSWRVDADRNDLYERVKKPRDVIEKEGPERGTYQCPGLFGKPPEKGMNYRAVRDSATAAAVSDSTQG